MVKTTMTVIPEYVPRCKIAMSSALIQEVVEYLEPLFPELQEQVLSGDKQ
jgi:hypothetical protein